MSDELERVAALRVVVVCGHGRLVGVQDHPRHVHHRCFSARWLCLVGLGSVAQLVGVPTAAMTCHDCAEMIISLHASVADQLAFMTEQAKFADALAATARVVTEQITKVLCCATDADMPGIRSHVPQPEPAPQPKASTVKPALTSLTTMHSIDHRPGLWQAADGQA